ncbi:MULTISPECIES: pyrroloquinoline quinone biosynthesis peptide chaperone PqqD [Rhizobium/Agrobacterium group]|jgi:pyrroloquinoline quinone biosynthesis protein D|uniref:Pyrroloquinoline quinone biosynthesis peptide chaperone PqqD n=2 Tax=Neorhizobium TaxID=1525371 RepID=A0ABV0M7N1_9HYPH|nr:MULTISPECIES: pyrroloquinoline quinone biosynthesis peptide chaperone PqqD [Rhizobium/Agrobacterium group]KGD96501.1 pyrroloquinoline quinone biosynthesis protein PqqD [Rhizobium sp. YS-1r]MCC2611935.1 pyrroloquinoline quinone biosynthesis peptide chaperone PqqD [Neorhizobium petrolearium]WGI67097.1 pyrroloquinoline quinone biosynthesis peptide chaperone PqqD [Neorhizobium petrolearium]
MEARRQRVILSGEARPRLKRYVRLQYDPVRGAWALLSPERVFWPDEVSLDILRLCDGQRTVSQIVDELAGQYDAAREDIAPDVEQFLQEWSDRFLVTL